MAPTAPRPPPRRSARRSTSPSCPAPRSSIVSAYAPIPARTVKDEQRDAPADVQYEIGPREDVNLVLDAAAADARKAGIEVQTHPVEGDPAEAILNVAEETKADLIVVGNKGMTGARRLSLLSAGVPESNISHYAALQRDHRPHDLSSSHLA